MIMKKEMELILAKAENIYSEETLEKEAKKR